MAVDTERDAFTGRQTTGHEWDGIKELNTPLPTWWLYTFYATIAFAIVWCVLYPSLPWLKGTLGYTERKGVAATLEKAAAGQKTYLDRILKSSVEEIRKDQQLLAFARAGGRIAFNNNCAPCHQSGGAGTLGYPNLADDDWLWGGTAADIEQTIRYGIRSEHDKSRNPPQMPRFGVEGVLTAGQIDDVVEYVLSLSKAPHDAARAARGATVFAKECVTCHKEGGVGNREMGAPALNDAIWLYGGDRAAIRATVFSARSGVMPAWQDRLDDATIKMLTLYVHSLGGGK
ncbi:MAG: cytochrome-c oxidase, cbb3-type subunit III [Alphaproteobacteria bacterium]|nr:cytochrome-c oxidase, cbb3-type subunit III [Alphaproteobacteria bacterium]